MLLAEDLLLLLTDDDSGRTIVSGTEIEPVLAGAMLIDLTLQRRLDVTDPGAGVKEGRLVVLDPTPTGEPLLDEALEKVAQVGGKKPGAALGKLGGKLRPRLLGGLVDKGILREEKGRFLRLFPHSRWPAEDAAHEHETRSRIESALRSGLAGDERTGALVALLHAVRAVPKTFPPETTGLSKKETNANAKRISEGDWASAAVRSAIDSMNAAVMVAITAATTTAATSG
jgi:Golgi phosphoprotein 3 (GPP34)